MINKVTLIGHLGQDPEIHRLENGTPVGRFSLATSESYKDAAGELQTQTEWHNIVVWREQAVQAEKILKKGSLAYIEGKISYRKYTDKNGVERTTTDITALTWRALGSKNGSSNNDSHFPSTEHEPAKGRNEEQTSNEPTKNESQFFDGLGNQINVPYSCNVSYKVKSGKFAGKEYDIKIITAEKVDFTFHTGESMSFDKATFDDFFKICEVSELPF